ncbi:MAG: SDR family NAD(P)-dependent oxidoreductase [Rhodospirillaceae bacterium]
MAHPALTADSVAVITGAASGIGYAAAHRFAQIGMRLVLVDRNEATLSTAGQRLRDAGAPDVMTAPCDVSDRAQMVALQAEVSKRFGGTDLLLNNAGIGGTTSCLDAFEQWQSILAVNFQGVLNGVQAFGPEMIARGRPGAIINTGSKQGITTPPGNPAYNVSKAALKVYTEALAHELRNTDQCQVTAHLLIPGYVYTGMTGMADNGPEAKPASAWTADQTVDFMLESLNRGDFYILCPDNDVSRDLDEKRIAWTAGDIIENRPALSRWHPDYKATFAKHLKGDI